MQLFNLTFCFTNPCITNKTGKPRCDTYNNVDGNRIPRIERDYLSFVVGRLVPRKPQRNSNNIYWCTPRQAREPFFSCHSRTERLMFANAKNLGRCRKKKQWEGRVLNWVFKAAEMPHTISDGVSLFDLNRMEWNYLFPLFCGRNP